MIINEVIDVCIVAYGEINYVIFHRSGCEEIRTRMRLIPQRKYSCVRTQECDVVAIDISNKKAIYFNCLFIHHRTISCPP